MHPIAEIAARISQADDRRVRLWRESDALEVAASGDESLRDPASAVVRALGEPLDFPPIASSTVPGDQIAIALNNELPCAAQIVRGAVDALLQAGIEPDSISIVTTDAATGERCRDALAHITTLPHLVIHDPWDDANLCMVGLTKRGETLLVNRTIFDADIVLPIGVARVSGVGPYESLYPRFANADAIERHRNPANSASARFAAERIQEANEAGWMIGAPLVVQIVPGAGESVACVVAGDPQSVARQCESLCRQRWLLHSPRQVDLVIATITGDLHTQTWANIGRALVAAESVLTADGAIAVCTNLEELPGESLGRLIGSNDLEKTERKINHDKGADSWPAWHLARALQRGPVYLLSQLAADTVEDMGLAPVADIAELARLAGRHESFILLEDSQHAAVTVDSDNEGEE